MSSDSESDADYVPSDHEGDGEEDQGTIEGEKEGNNEEAAASDNVDDLWADFLRDAGETGGGQPSSSASTATAASSATSISSKPTDSTTTTATTAANDKPPPPNAANDQSKNPSSSMSATVVETKPAMKEESFEFAGETIKVSKEVFEDTSNKSRTESSSNNTVKLPTTKRKATGGLLGAVSAISKAPKISTLTKSKLDWESYKSDNQLDEELKTQNRGKDGYLERQEFLDRADHRRFEQEKSARNRMRKPQT